MSKKNKQSPANEITAVENEEVIATKNLKEDDIVIAEETVVEATIEAPVEEEDKKEMECTKIVYPDNEVLVALRDITKAERVKTTTSN